MHEIEITMAPQLSDQEKSTTDLHSIFNILHIVRGELSLIRPLCPSEAERLSPIEDTLIKLTQTFRQSTTVSLDSVRLLADQHQPIIEAIQAMRIKTANPDLVAEYELSEANLKSVFEVLKQRQTEREAMAQRESEWVDVSTSAFQHQLTSVLRAIEKNARGRYHICFTPEQCKENDYYVMLDIQSAQEGQPLHIPSRLQDIVRDLLANARKYTHPNGGQLSLKLYQDATGIDCIIEDNGIGIPKLELENVIDFGYRASNSGKIPSYGGGIGLTKAAWLVKEWGGRLWLASEEAVGTRVRFYIPNSQDA